MWKALNLPNFPLWTPLKPLWKSPESLWRLLQLPGALLKLTEASWNPSEKLLKSHFIPLKPPEASWNSLNPPWDHPLKRFGTPLKLPWKFSMKPPWTGRACGATLTSANLYSIRGLSWTPWNTSGTSFKLYWIHMELQGTVLLLKTSIQYIGAAMRRSDVKLVLRSILTLTVFSFLEPVIGTISTTWHRYFPLDHIS